MGFFEIYGEQKTLTQWDVGRKLTVQEDCTHVHYANAAMTEAIVCKVSETDGVLTAPIPDEVLQVSGQLRVYAFLDGHEGYTRHIQTFFVKARPKPAGYVYTPAEWVKLEDVMARMDVLENRAETDPTVPAWAKNAQKPAYTAAEVGAAPAGFGLGTDAPAVLHTLVEVNNYKKSGWATATLTSGHIMGFPNALIRVDAGANYIVQTAYAYFKYYGGFFELKRITNDSGDWQPWEWVNPDFRAGAEYRTTERFNGKPVYVKTIDIGSLPVGAGFANRINFYPVLSDIDKLVRWDGMVTNGKASYTLPVTGGNNLGNKITAYYHEGTVYLETNGDYSAYTGTATFWWTKTTD